LCACLALTKLMIELFAQRAHKCAF